MSKDAKRALDERLEATSADYRSMRNRLREASILLLVVGLLQVILGIFLYAAAGDGSEDPTVMGSRVLAIVNCVIGVGMLTASQLLERRPRTVIIVVITVWVGIQLLFALLSPLSIFSGLLLKFLVLVVLVRGFSAAGRAARLKQQLTIEASAQ